jgi:HK97 family phage portal protein
MELVLRRAQPSGTWLTRFGAQLRSIVLGPWSSKDKTLARMFGGNATTTAGVVVNEQTAFTYSAVFDAVNQISSDVAKLPLNLHKRNKEGGSDHYIDSKLYWLLKFEPNPEMGSMVFRRTLQAHALTCKGAFAEIERDGLNRPVALWPITPDRVEPFREELRDNSGKVRLGPIQYRLDGGDTVIPAKDMLHVHGLGYDGHGAYSVIDKARQAIGLALAAERFGSSFFGNGTTFGGVLSTDEDIDEDEEKAYTDKLKALHGGPERAHKFLVLSGGTWKYERLGVDPDKSQMDALRTKQVEEVARFFNMPLHKLKNLDRATNNNIEQQDLEYYKGCLLTWLTLWEEELNRKLIAPLERRQQFIKHNANAFLRGDIKSRYEALGIARDKGIINADEWRELEDMNPQPDGQGRFYLVPANMTPAHRLMEFVDAQIDRMQAKPESTPPPSGPDRTGEIEELQRRAELAEAAAAEAREAAAADQTKRIEAEATGTANAAEIAHLRESERTSQALATQLGLLAEELRTKHDALAVTHAETVAELARETSARTEAERAALTAQAAADAAETARLELARQASAAADTARHAREEAEAAVQRALEAQATADAAGTDSAAARAARETADERAASALARADQAETERDRLQAAYDAAVTSEAEAKATAERRIAELLSQVEISAAEREIEATARAVAEQEATRQREAAADAEAARVALEARAAALEAENVAADSALRTQRQAELERLTRSIGAHRALIAEAMGRMIRREVEKARRQQASPDKLRKWLETFDILHVDVCVDALLPAVRTHLAWTKSADDPMTMTTALVSAHIAEFTRQLRAVCDSPAEEYHALLERTLQRWEAEQADRVADQILREEIDYVRSLAQ